jgi:hypothetical protein
MEEEVKEVKTEKEVSKKRLSPEATLLLTIGGAALVVVVIGIVYFILK